MRHQVPSSSFAARLRLVLAVGALVTAAACAKGPSAPSGTDGATVSAPNLNASIKFCADEVNRYRAIAGLPALSRSADLEAFASKAAAYDAALGIPHQFFTGTNGGGVSKAENQLLMWKGYNLENVIRVGTQQMWAEGPGGSHYHVLTGNYTEVGCGAYEGDSGISVSQDFR